MGNPDATDNKMQEVQSSMTLGLCYASLPFAFMVELKKRGCFVGACLLCLGRLFREFN